MNSLNMKMALYGLRQHYNEADKTERIIIDSALVAAGACAVSSIIPAVAIPALIIECFGTVWVMYAKICNTLGIKIKENVLRLLARAALSNITANVGGVLITYFVGMLVPGASILAGAAVSFATVYLAGIIFLELLGKLADKSADPVSFSDISTAEMTRTVKNATVDKADFEAANGLYEANKASAAN